MIIIAIKGVKISLTITLFPGLFTMSIPKDKITFRRRHPYFGSIFSYTFWYLRNNSEKVCLTTDRTIHKCFYICFFVVFNLNNYSLIMVISLSVFGLQEF